MRQKRDSHLVHILVGQTQVQNSTSRGLRPRDPAEEPGRLRGRRGRRDEEAATATYSRRFYIYSFLLEFFNILIPP